eukprot:jgi/Chlat1/103/Chrsp1S03206
MAGSGGGRLRAAVSWLLVSLLVALPAVARARVTHSRIRRDDRAIILFDSFCFLPSGGVIDISIPYHELLLPTPQPAVIDKSRLGFFLADPEEEAQLDLALHNHVCVLKDRHVHLLFTWEDIDAVQRNETFRFYKQLTTGGDLRLFWANCQGNYYASFDVITRLYNTNSQEVKDFLPAGESVLPLLYFLCFGTYVLLAFIWIRFLVVKRSDGTHKIHVLMAVLVVLRALTAVSQAGMYQWVKTTGNASGWNIAFYIFSFFRGVMLFVVIVLVGTGWSFLKPYLQSREKRVLVFVIPLQVFANVAVVVLDETNMSSKAWFTWRDLFHLVDIICCCAILFPIVWSIKHLREAAEADGKAATNLQKLVLFRQFYVVAVGYIYSTRIVVYLLESTTPCELAWFSMFASEAVTMAFYLFVGFKFRPASDNPYFHAEEEHQPLVHAEEL